MYPDLSYLFHDLFGTPYDNFFAVFKTFGLLLAISLVAAGWVVYKEMKRREAIEGSPFQQAITTITKTVGQAPTWRDIVPSVLGGFFLGYKVLHIREHFDLFKADPVKILFSTEGNLGAGFLGAILLGGYAYWSKKRQQLAEPKVERFQMNPSDRVGDIIILAGVSGVIGAKLFAMFETMGGVTSVQDFLEKLLSGSGLAIYGGLILGAATVIWYVKRVKIPLFQTMDVAAPALFLAMGVGRLGCHLSGDGDWGIQAVARPDWWFLPDWLWSMDYPRNVSLGHTGVQAGEVAPEPISIDCEGCKYHYKIGYKVYPTSVYEFVMYGVTFLGLQAAHRINRIPGFLFFTFMSLYGIERWLIEKIRVNDILWMGLTQAELISISFFIIGVFGMGVLYARNKK